MTRGLPKRFYAEASLSALAGFFFLLTLAWKDWLERVFGLDPDRHNGSLEWLVVAGLLLAAVSFGALAHATRRRALPTP